MKMDQPTDETLRAEGADWVATLHGSLPSSPAEAREYEANCRHFIDWVRRSPDHVAGFLYADDAFCRLNGLDLLSHVDIDELRNRYSANIQEQSSSFSPKTSQRPRRFRRRTLFAVAASILLIFAGAISFEILKHSHEYATAVGEQLNVKLPDGSLMLLNTKSRVWFAFSAQQRLVYLTQGEALFEVEHDQKRPFIVLTPSARVRAVGTRFNVYQHPEGATAGGNSTTVSVLEGVVQIASQTSAAVNSVTEPSVPSETLESADTSAPPTQAPARLAAGEQASISRAGVTRHASPDVADAVAWRDRVLVFQGTSIADVAAEYNRYNTSQVRIEDTDIEQRQLSGTYSADRPENLVRYLEEAFPVAVTRQGNDWIVRRR